MPGPLEGLRVVELAGIGPAPFAAMLLADLGADVVRVERPGRSSWPADPQLDLLQRGKRSIVVDLKQADGVDVVRRLTDRADVLIEGYRPGVAERLGLGPEDCARSNPALVYGRMTGWGQDGPLADRAGHDIAYIALTGALHAMGRAGGPPQVPLNLVGDFGGGSLYLLLGVLAAVWEAGRSGRGQVVDAAIVDGAASLMAMPFAFLGAGLWQDRRGVNLLDTGAPFYDVYETSDGGWMAVGPLEPQFYAAFVQLLGLADDASMPGQFALAEWPELRRRFAEVFRTRTRDEWTEVFTPSDACVAPVLSMAEAPEHPHLAARGTYVRRNGRTEPAPAPRFDRTPATLTDGPPLPGTHSRELLEELGLDAASLLASGAVLAAGGDGGPPR
ncbi:MAG: alpha-methylacyl-CoA racemase [Frankiaceae bacterium]|nr:alpha-methylacyl-CoA racemase [Frankiaceae bacterium]MDQ1633270.1 alpha-methylacyl-CoA racemase [Frankiaceae bacterium]